jgi:MFS family permease
MSAVSAFGQGASNSIGMLIAFRVLGGLGGSSPPIAQAYIAGTSLQLTSSSDVATPGERPKYLSILGATMAGKFYLSHLQAPLCLAQSWDQVYRNFLSLFLCILLGS